MIFDQLDFKEEKVMDNEKIEKLQQMIDESDHIVFFGGAGVSTESHIPDFEARMVCITRLINIHPRLW